MDLTHVKGARFSETGRYVAQVALGVALMTLCSKVQIPLQPVPVTLQTFAVMFLGLTFSPSMAAASMLSYIGLGAIGVPVFAGSYSGLAYILGPTAGYIFGMALACCLIAIIRQKLNIMTVKPGSFWVNLAAVAVGPAVYFSLGLAWLTNFVGAEKALALGFYPFIIPSLVKLGLVSAAVSWYRKV